MAKIKSVYICSECGYESPKCTVNALDVKTGIP